MSAPRLLIRRSGDPVIRITRRGARFPEDRTTGSPDQPAGRRVALLLALCVGACGYQLSHGGMPGGQRVRVAAVRNGTAQAELGGVFGTALRSELDARGHLAADGSAAPELGVELLAVRSLPVGLGAQGASLFRVEADLRARLAAWQDVVSGGEEYFAGVDVLGTEANRRAALRRLAGQLSRELVERLEATAAVSAP